MDVQSTATAVSLEPLAVSLRGALIHHVQRRGQKLGLSLLSGAVALRVLVLVLVLVPGRTGVSRGVGPRSGAVTATTTAAVVVVRRSGPRLLSRAASLKEVLPRVWDEAVDRLEVYSTVALLAAARVELWARRTVSGERGEGVIISLVADLVIAQHASMRVFAGGRPSARRHGRRAQSCSVEERVERDWEVEEKCKQVRETKLP